MKLHHLGYVVNDIPAYEKHQLSENKIKDIFDPVQNSRMALYSNFGDAYIELIQPINEKSFTYNFLQKNGNSFHHLCYEILSEKELQAVVEKQRLILVKGPLPAILFDNRNVWFFYTRNKQIVEFVL